MLNFCNLINSIDKHSYDTLTIYIEDEDYSEGVASYLGIKFENSVTKQYKIQKLSLIEPDEEKIEILNDIIKEEKNS